MDNGDIAKMVYAIPETLILYFFFTVINVWLTVSLGWTKKLIGIVFSILTLILITGNTISYITIQEPQIANSTSITGGFKYTYVPVTNSTNLKILTTPIAKPVQQVMLWSSIFMLIMSIGLFSYEFYEFIGFGSKQTGKEQA